jgi:tetratricopeptide (TPR) repeat protein
MRDDLAQRCASRDAKALQKVMIMATKKSGWPKFPYDQKSFDFSGDKLKKAWPSLHAGDCEPYPDEKRAAALIKTAGKSAPKGVDADTLAQTLQQGWAAYHKGDFQQAFELAEPLGAVGASLACKALGIHTAYLVEDESEQLKRFEQAGKLAEAAIAALPEDANSHYRYAFAMGRYSQGISIVKAIKLGLASKVRKALDKTLELAPKHAEAQTALALYHAEIIDKIGAMIGAMTYGAKASEAEKLMGSALKLTPDSPIAHLEHGNMLMLLYGDKKEDAAANAIEKASKLKPKDAMEKLDAEHAKAQLE